jgi:DNA-directed RNA polymerase specialized sigma24 family protein
MAVRIAALVFDRTHVVSIDLVAPPPDPKLNPEARVIHDGQMAHAERLMNSTPAREREIIASFYLEGERKDSIIARMRLTETQFRLTKCRGLQRLRERAAA